jgi:membrane protein DedA with SNARE-associated domain
MRDLLTDPVLWGLIICVESFGAPIPVLPAYLGLAGAVLRGRLSFMEALGIAVAMQVLGFLVSYGIGWVWGIALWRWSKKHRWMRKRLIRALRAVKRRGIWAVPLFRFTGPLRSFAGWIAGSLHVSPLLSILLTLPAAAAYGAWLVGVSLAGIEGTRRLVRGEVPIVVVILLVAAVLAACVFAWFAVSRARCAQNR